MKNRNYGIDLLRIISMIFIVILHILGQGGIIENSIQFSLNYQLVWLLEIIAYTGVNIYAIISGYVGIDSKFKYKNIFKLTIQVMFYTIGITLLFKIFNPNAVTNARIIESFFPFAIEHYWYFTAYFGMFFFIPFMQKLVNSFEKNDAKRFITSFFIIFSILPIIFRADIYYMNWGYHVLWLSLLYMIGGCIKKFGFNNFIEKHLLTAYIICNLITILGKIAMEYIMVKIKGPGFLDLTLVSYTSPTMVLSSIVLVMLFAKLKIKDIFIKIIEFLAPLSFSVYLIHTEPLIWINLLKNSFISYASYNPVLLVFAVLATALIIYIVCIFIEYIRVLLFKYLRVDKLLDLIYNFIVKLIKKISNFKKCREA